MFNPHQHQQQQQQFHQHLRQLQQLFQHQTPPPPPPPPPPPQPPPAHHIPHHHQGGRPITVAAPAPPPPRMVNLCSAPQTLIAPNPMLQGALLMQQMQAGSMRGFAMGGQQFPQFFSPGSRTSLLGPVPMGVAIKTPHMGFPRHFSPHARYFNSDFQARQPDRKRENEQRSAGNSDNHSESSRSRDESSAVADPACQSSEQPDEPAAKKRKTDGSEESLDTEAAQNSDDKSPGAAAATQEQCRSGAYDADAAADADQRTVVEQIDSTESSVKDPEQQNTDSQDDVTGSNSAAEGKEPAESAAESPLTARDPEELTDGGGEASNKFICYICNITCHNQQNFQSHMNGLSHQQKMMEIQHMSNACLVTLLPRVQESLQGTRKDGEKRPGLQRWCSTCQTHFTTNVTDHRRTEEHKRCSVSSSSTCTVCKQHFRTSREFVMHMQSAEHKQRAEQLWRSSGKEALDELNAEMFMGEEDGDISSEEREDEENGKEGLFGHMEVTLEDLTEEEEFDPDVVYGSSFVVPVAGFVCRLCNHFYHFESSARHTHCKTLKHFQNLKRYKALKKHEDSGSASGEPTDQQNQQNLSPEETSDREPHFTSPDSLIPKSAPEDTPLPSGSVISSHPTANQKTSSCQAPPPPNQQSKPEEDQPDVNAEEEPVTGEPEEEEEEDGPVHAPEGKPSRGRGRTAAKRRGRGGRRR